MVLLSLISFMSTGYTVYAEPNKTSSSREIFTESKDLSNPGLPTASSEEVANYAERKGFEVVNILQRFAEPFMIIIFIIGAFMFLLGLASKGPAMRAGLFMMLFSCVCYAGVKYAPTIMDAFVNWAKK